MPEAFREEEPEEKEVAPWVSTRGCHRGWTQQWFCEWSLWSLAINSWDFNIFNGNIRGVQQSNLGWWDPPVIVGLETPWIPHTHTDAYIYIYTSWIIEFTQWTVHQLSHRTGALPCGEGSNRSNRSNLKGPAFQNYQTSMGFLCGWTRQFSSFGWFSLCQ